MSEKLHPLPLPYSILPEGTTPQYLIELLPTCILQHLGPATSYESNSSSIFLPVNRIYKHNFCLYHQFVYFLLHRLNFLESPCIVDTIRHSSSLTFPFQFPRRQSSRLLDFDRPRWCSLIISELFTMPGCMENRVVRGKQRERKAFRFVAARLNPLPPSILYFTRRWNKRGGKNISNPQPGKIRKKTEEQKHTHKKKNSVVSVCVRRAIGGGSALERERQRVVSEQFDRSWVDKSPSPWKLMSRAPGARYEILWNSHSSKSTIALYVRAVARSLSLLLRSFYL